LKELSPGACRKFEKLKQRAFTLNIHDKEFKTLTASHLNLESKKYFVMDLNLPDYFQPTPEELCKQV
jgi:hypothetical protein